MNDRNYPHAHPAQITGLSDGAVYPLTAVFTLPEAHHIRMRTANGIKRPIQQELKRRTSKVRVFPNRDSLECLSTAVLVKVDEKWETETNAYIKWEKRDN